MESEVTFFATGDPKGQPRPRAFSRGGHVRVYDPGTAEGWKGQIAIACKSKIPAEPIKGPVRIVLTFYFARPASHYFTGKRRDVRRPDAPGAHLAKPDADNLAKAVLDAMTTLGFWRDDSQVCDLYVIKQYADTIPGCNVQMFHQ